MMFVSTPAYLIIPLSNNKPDIAFCLCVFMLCLSSPYR